MSFQLGALYHNPSEDTYYCLGCGATLQTPVCAVLKADTKPVPVENNPENRLLWLELMELDHADCGKFKDAQKSEDHRTYRRPVITFRKGDDGPFKLGPPA
jgi:hypothetical protein